MKASELDRGRKQAEKVAAILKLELRGWGYVSEGISLFNAKNNEYVSLSVEAVKAILLMEKRTNKHILDLQNKIDHAKKEHTKGGACPCIYCE